jgi:hypothetical protein
LWELVVVDTLSAMARYTCYLGLPRAALVEILSESDCFLLMQALWHQAGGAWAVVHERQRNELARLAEEFELTDDGSTLVDRYARLCSTLDERYPHTLTPCARVKWAHDLLQAVLAHHFRSQGIASAAGLASAAVHGEIAGAPLGELMCLSEATVRRIGRGLCRANPCCLLDALPTLGEQDSLRQLGASRSERRECLSALAHDSDVRRELEDLVFMYAHASEWRQLVLIG